MLLGAFQMAQVFALRAVHGANQHDQRGNDNLVRLLGPDDVGLKPALIRLGLTRPDPADPATSCVPHWLLEGLLARVAVFDAAARARVWATSSLSCAALGRLHDVLVHSEFDFSVVTFAELVYRLNSWVRPTDAAELGRLSVAAGADVFAHSALPAAAQNDDVNTQVLRSMTWGDFVDGTEISTRLYGDLSLLTQGRYSHALRTDNNAYFKRAFARLSRHAERAAAVCEKPDDRDTEDRVDDLPSSICEYVLATSLPWQLVTVAVGVSSFVAQDFAAREAVRASALLPVITRRWPTFILHFPTLQAVVAGTDAAEAISQLQVLGSALTGTISSVAQFMALELAASRLVFVLEENTPDGVVRSLSTAQRVAAFVAATRSHTGAATMTTMTSPTPASGGGSSSGHGAFSKGNQQHLLAWRNSAHFNSVAANLQPALDSDDSVRVIRRLFKQRDLVLYQYVMAEKTPVTDVPLLTAIEPHKAALGRCIAQYIVMPKHAPASVLDSASGPDSLLDSVSERRRKWRLSDNALKLLREGKFDEIDYYTELVVSLEDCDAGGQGKSAVPRLSWPDAVCEDKVAVESVRNLGNDLFTAIGFADNDKLGFFGIFNEVYLMLSGATPGTLPGSLMAKLVKEQLSEAAQRMRTALSHSAAHPFPVFSKPTDVFFAELGQMYNTRALLTAACEAGLVSPTTAAKRPAADADGSAPNKGPRPANKGKGKGAGADGRGKGKGKGNGGRGGGGRNGTRKDDGPKVAATDTSVTIGKRANHVSIDSQHMVIQITPRARLKWDIHKMNEIYDSLGEDKATICRPCSALRSAHRLEFCCHATDTNHLTHDAPAHTFVNPLADLVSALDKALTS